MANDGTKYCVKCKEVFNSRLVANPNRCPRCDHKVTLWEDFNYQFFGTLGFGGCLVVAIIILIVLAIICQFKGYILYRKRD